MTTEELWQAALGEIELSVSKANFVTWIKNAELIEKNEGTCILEVPNQFTKEWLKNKCNDLILKSLRNVSSDVKKVEYKVADRPSFSNSSSSQNQNKKKTKKKTKKSSQEQQLDLLDSETKKGTNLNPEFIFNNFVVGSFNELAHAASLSITDKEKLGKKYNPLFIYGGVGLGKTHLLQAIGNKLIEKYDKHLKIKYISSEAFTSELINAIRNQNVDEFKKKYRKIDALIIDDIQFLSGKEKTQIEFFHTFNALYGDNKQIVLSSDKPPKGIPELEKRLRSRFEGGMMADISPPDFESRVAILEEKAKEFELELDKEIMEYIAKKAKKNIREIEGALNQISAYANAHETIPNLQKAKKLLKGITAQPRMRATPKEILNTVASFYEVPKKKIINGGRKREYVKPRQITMYLLRKELDESYPYIGKKIGGKDHTTVIHACKKIEEEKEEKENLDAEIKMIKEKIYNK